MIGVGDLVVCVKPFEDPRLGGEVDPVVGAIYTVRMIRMDDIYYGAPAPWPGVLLEEIRNPPIRQFGREIAYCIHKFRPVRKSSIEIFRQIAANPKQRVTA